MNKLTRIFLVGMVLTLVFALALPVMAQDEPAPATGKPIVEPNFGSDINTLNPILNNDGPSADMIDRIYPLFLGINPDTGYFGQGQENTLVTSWEVSEDGLVYTFALRDDLFWTDGTPVTAADVIYFWDALNDPAVNGSGIFGTARDLIASLEAPDDYTVVATFNNPDCNAVDTIADFYAVPAHVYSEVFPNRGDMNDSPENLNPRVTAGPWSFLNYRPGEQVTLIANPDHPDGTPLAQGWIYKNIADQIIQTEQFLNGQIDVMDSVPDAREAELLALAEAGEYHYNLGASATTRFIAFNMGDPTNPQPGFDEDGNRIDQGLHPIFGDVRVRQALNYAMNFEEINAGVMDGTGWQIPAHVHPTNWAFPSDLEPYPFDQDQATALLEEAGWTDTDGDGVRECNGCLYATEVDPSFEGSLLEFDLRTNAGNTSQEALGQLLQDQWGQVGAVVDFQAIDFNTLVDSLLGQTFDTIMVFYGLSTTPADPDELSNIFLASNDIPNAGINGGSWYNERFEELVNTARSLPGCDQEERAELYAEAYRIQKEESPWIWVGGSSVLAVAQPTLEGWQPNSSSGNTIFWNEEQWYIAP